MGDVSQKHSAQTVRDVPLFDGRGIDHVGIRYHDLQKAVGWFRDTLGLPVDHETRTMAFVRVGGDGSHLALFKRRVTSRYGSHTMSRCVCLIPLQPRRHYALRRSAPSLRSQLGLPGSRGERLPLHAVALAPSADDPWGGHALKHLAPPNQALERTDRRLAHRGRALRAAGRSTPSRMLGSPLSLSTYSKRPKNSGPRGRHSKDRRCP